ncbi:MAG: hypothetical protein ABI995_11480, partial [Acidobacteriota bacterium]
VLHDLYTALGKTTEAKQQAGLLDAAAALDEASGEKANRTLALIYANEGLNLKKALAMAQADVELRGGVYTQDALAWTLYKNGRSADAWRVAQGVAAVGTPDGLLIYHYGMIALAQGHKEEAKASLESALRLNPAFDFSQAPLARQALRDLQ